MKRSQLHWLWQNSAAPNRFRTGVSLHSHTLHSEESLAFVPRYLGGVPIVSDIIRHQESRHFELTGRVLDFSRTFWRPPLAPREAFSLEKSQIENKLGIRALVSLSDHDDIQAGYMLQVVEPETPISVEWTISFGPSFFHLGIHNLPRDLAPSIMQDLASFTAAPNKPRLRELLSALNEIREVLIVLNHPMWDEARIGEVEHAQLSSRFLERFGEYIHALELNGLRPWKENRRVLWQAEQFGHAVISGGDRHGLEANANINLTNARTFSEFVAEIRDDGVSSVLFMPQYRETLRVRMVETMWDVVRDYPDFPVERRRWSDRVFHRHDDGQVRPLSSYWHGNEPWPIRFFLSGLRAVKSQHLRPALRLALADSQEARI